MTLDAEPILFAQRLMQDTATGTAREGIAVRVGRLEATDNPDKTPVYLLENAGELHSPDVAMYLPARISVTAYGETEDDAILLYRAASDLFHRRGRTQIEQVVMGGAFDETGPQPREDPNTNWHSRFGVIALYIADVPLGTPGS